MKNKAYKCSILLKNPNNRPNLTFIFYFSQLVFVSGRKLIEKKNKKEIISVKTVGHVTGTGECVLYARRASCALEGRPQVVTSALKSLRRDAPSFDSYQVFDFLTDGKIDVLFASKTRTD